MSDFSAIFEFLAEVVTAIVNFSINAICGCFLVVSASAPWRWGEIYQDFEKGGRHWKSYCLESFFCTMLDFIKIPMVLTGLTSPVRWYAVVKILFKMFFGDMLGYTDRGDRLRDRFSGFVVLFVVFADLLCLPLSLVVFLNPFGRQFILAKVIVWRDSYSVARMNDDDTSHLNLDINKCVLKYGSQGIIDIGVFMFSLFCVLAPSTWLSFYRGINDMLDHPPRNVPVLYSAGNRKQYYKRWNDWFETLREHVFAQFLHALVDFGVAIFFLLAALAPYRNRQLMDAIAKSNSRYTPLNRPSAPSEPTVDMIEIPDENGFTTMVPVPKLQVAIVRHPVGDFEYEYDYQLRKDVFYIGLLAVSDFLLMPMLLPLFLTRYRYHSIKDKLFDENGTWGHQQLFLVASQFLFLVIDGLLLTWSIPIIFFTILRWEPLLTVLSKDEIFLNGNGELYSTVLFQLLMLCVDALFLPGLMIVLLSQYRRNEIVRAINDPPTMADNFRIHYLIGCNVVVIFHDIVLFLPAMIAIVFFAPHRILIVVHRFFLRSPIAVPKSNCPYYETKRYQDDCMSGDWDARFDCWGQFIHGVLDIPFFIMGCAVIATGWRAPQLYKKCREIKFDERFWVQYPTKLHGIYRKIASHCFEQFWMLLVDILCLIPLGIIAATMYRIPELYNSFCNVFRAEPLKVEPAFNVISATINYPVGGEPRIELNLKGNNDLDQTTFDNFQLHILGESLWADTARIFGGLVAGLAKSYLPLNLIVGDSVGFTPTALEISEINCSVPPIVDKTPDIEVDEASTKVSGISLETQTQSDNIVPSAPNIDEVENSVGLQLWMLLPLKGVKKSTVIKKLAKFDASQQMIWQLECTASNGDNDMLSRRLLFRYVVPVADVLKSLNSDSSAIVVDQPSDAVNLLGEAPSFVDEFHLLVLKVFAEVVLDFIHLILFCFTMLDPKRFYTLVRCMLEPKARTDVRLIEKILFSINQAEIHLRNFRSTLVPSLNETCKTQYGDRMLEKNSYFRYMSTYELRNELEEVQSEYDFGRYKSLCASVKRDMALLDLASDEFSSTVQTLFSLHDAVMTYWFLKYGVWSTVSYKEMTRNEIELSSLVFSDQHNMEAKKLVSAKIKLLNIYSEENYRVTTKNSKVPGFVKRTANQNRSLIRSFCRGVITDLVGIFMILLLVVTMIRLIPTVRDLYINFFSAAPISLRSLLTKQIRLLRYEMFYIGITLFYVTLLIVTAVGIPAFLADLPNHVHSIKAVAMCAKHHAKKFFSHLWKLLSFITVFRTYRMLLKSALYCVLLPGAFIGDTMKSMSEKLNFMIGSLVFFGILIACIATSVKVSNAGLEHSNADIANDAILGISATICIVLAILAYFILRKNCLEPQKSDTKRLSISWSHIVGFLLGPMDCLQLSAVIMYFFWNPATVKHGSPVVTVIESRNLRLGGDYLSSIIFWNSENSNHSSVYRTTMTIAAVLILVWALLIALPIAQGGSESTGRRQMKMLQIRNGPVYDALYFVLSNSISIWIIATLMRSWSCVENEFGDAVLSTMPNVTCGGGEHFWSGAVSFPFLSYYLITSALVYADSGTNLENKTTTVDENGGGGYVRFSSSYAAIMKVIQCFICAACIGAFTTAPAIAVLLPILIISLMGSVLPRLIPLFSQQRVCNVPGILPLRSASYIAIGWTTVVCIIRSFADSPERMQRTYIFAHEGVIYVGWAIIYIIALWQTFSIENQMREEWKLTLIDQGLNDAIERLVETYDAALIETDNYKNFLVENDAIITHYKEKIGCCRSVQDLALLIIHLEKLIVVDKLSDDFLRQRKGWVRNLMEAHFLNHVAGAAPRAELLLLPDVEKQESITTKRFHGVLDHITILNTAFRKQLVASNISRDVLYILLSNQLPRDVCWYIFEYLFHTNDLRNVLTSKAIGRHSLNPPELLKSKGKHYSSSMLNYVASFINAKHELLKGEVSNELSRHK